MKPKTEPKAVRMKTTSWNQLDKNAKKAGTIRNTFVKKCIEIATPILMKKKLEKDGWECDL